MEIASCQGQGQASKDVSLSAATCFFYISHRLHVSEIPGFQLVVGQILHVVLVKDTTPATRS